MDNEVKLLGNLVNAAIFLSQYEYTMYILNPVAEHHKVQ